MSFTNTEDFLPKNFVWQGITLTNAAVKQIKSLTQKEKDIKGLHLSIKKSGCAGFEYVMKLVKEVTNDDLQFSYHDINLFVPLQSMPFIDGTELDYVQEGLNEMFKFNNPKAQHTCGCGGSFAV